MKSCRMLLLTTLLLLALNGLVLYAQANSEVVEVSTFSQLNAALTDPAGASVKLVANIDITRAEAGYTEAGILVGPAFYTLDLNGHTLQYRYIALSGDPDGSPLVTQSTKGLTIRGSGNIIGGAYAIEQGSRQGVLTVEDGHLHGVMNSGIRMTSGLAYLNGGTITGNFYSVFHEDGIVVSQGSDLSDAIVRRSMGQEVQNYGVVEKQVFRGNAVLDDFVLIIDNLTIAQGASMRIERRGGLIVKNTFQNLGTYLFNGGLESFGGVALLKSEAQVRLNNSLALTSLTLEPQANLRIEEQAQITVNGPFISRNGGVEVISGKLILKGSIENTGHASGVPELTEPTPGGADQPNPVEDTSHPASWAAPHIVAARTSWLPESHLFSFYQDNIRREEFAELVVRLYEALSRQEAPLPQVNPFTDIDLLHVQKAAELGIVTGRGGGLFDPFGLITRQEMATMYYRLLNALHISPVVTMDYVSFADEELISDYAKPPLQLMYKIGIILGEGTSNIVMAPLRNSSRETALVISNRIYNLFSN